MYKCVYVNVCLFMCISILYICQMCRRDKSYHWVLLRIGQARHHQKHYSINKMGETQDRRKIRYDTRNDRKINNKKT